MKNRKEFRGVDRAIVAGVVLMAALVLTTSSCSSLRPGRPADDERGPQASQGPQEVGGVEEFLLTRQETFQEDPPELSVNGTRVAADSIDWESGAGAVSMKESSENLDGVPSVRGATGDLEVVLGASVEPASWEVSVYHGRLSEIDPYSSPDETLTIDPSQLDPAPDGFRTTVRSRSEGPLVVSMHVEFHSPPSTNGSRFSNYANWAFSVD